MPGRTCSASGSAPFSLPDPAGPLFRGQPPEKRIDRDDAEEVIVIHTDPVFGDISPVGTADIDVVWPDSDQTDPAKRHGYAKLLVTYSSLYPMQNTDSSPFGADAIGFHFPDDMRRSFRLDTVSLPESLHVEYQPESAARAGANIASHSKD